MQSSDGASIGAAARKLLPLRARTNQIGSKLRSAESPAWWTKSASSGAEAGGLSGRVALVLAASLGAACQSYAPSPLELNARMAAVSARLTDAAAQGKPVLCLVSNNPTNHGMVSHSCYP